MILQRFSCLITFIWGWTQKQVIIQAIGIINNLRKLFFLHFHHGYLWIYIYSISGQPEIPFNTFYNVQLSHKMCVCLFFLCVWHHKSFAKIYKPPSAVLNRFYFTMRFYVCTPGTRWVSCLTRPTFSRQPKRLKTQSEKLSAGKNCNIKWYE